MERGDQEVTRSIAREDATRPIPTVGGRRQSKDEHPCGGVAETGQGSTPIRLGREASDLLGRDLFAPRDKSRTDSAVDDLGGQLVEG